MADEIKIDFTADVRKVIKGTDEIGTALDETKRTLDDVGEDGARSLEKLTDAQADTEAGAKNLGGTVAGELSDAFRDFDGTAEGAVEGAGAALSGLAALIPGIGGLIGAGLGAAATGMVDLWQTSSKKTEDRVRSMYEDMIESGNRFLSESAIQQQIKAIVDDADALGQLAEYATTLGIGIDTLVAAEAGSTNARREVLAKVNEELETNVKLQEDGTFESQEQLTAVENYLTKLEIVKQHFDTITALQQEQIDKANVYDQAVDAAKGGLELQNEELQKRNTLIALTPATVSTKLVVDDSDLKRKLAQSPTIRVNIEGFARNGSRVV